MLPNKLTANSLIQTNYIMQKFYTMTKTIFLLAICLLALINYGHAQATYTEMSFDGTNDYMYIGDFEELDTEYTIEFYFRVDSIPSNDGEGTFWNFDGYEFTPWCGISSDSSISIYDYDEYYYWTESGTILPDITYHVAFVWDGNEGRLYLDGVLHDAQEIPITLPSGYFTIGDTDPDGGYPLKGYIDEFRVSYTDRYTDSIASIDPLPWEFDNDTYVLFHFDECSGQWASSDGGSEIIVLGNSLDVDDYDPTWYCSVAVSEKDFENKITVYPNPTTDNFSIDLGTIYSYVNINITDITGKSVYSGSYHQTDLIEVNLEVGAGVYFLSLCSDEHKATFKLFKH